MRRLANKFFGLFGYSLVRKTARMSAVDDYVAWSKKVFGQKIYPVLDSSLKAASSFPTESPVFGLVAGGLDAAEMRYARALLQDIKDRGVPGHLAEFGVFEGQWINRLHDLCEATGLDREIWGFDSFQGLSKPDSDKDEPFWEEGMFSAGIDLVRRNVKAAERPSIVLVEGFFEESLSQETAQSVTEIAYARIDCDIYPPTVDCLKYLTSRLSHGAVLVFDDWSHTLNHGETRAFAEWLPDVPHLEFEFLFYGLWDHFYIRVWHKGEPRWNLPDSTMTVD